MINQIVEFNKTFVAQKEIMVVAHSHCGACHMSYAIKTHPLVPKDIVVRGFIIDSETGKLEEIV